jgi:pimeloyl-ACP methyl ester carboxylesterase
MASADAPQSRSAIPSDLLYQPPTLLGDERLGSVLRLEPLQAPKGIAAWAALYVSTGFDVPRTGVSGIILAPDEAAPRAARPILAWAHYTTGLADQCAPSHAGASGDVLDIARPFLADGYIVVATDYEGLGTPGPHPYVVGLSEGRSILDSLRAVRNLRDCRAGRDVAVLGLSQGGHAALWAAELAPTYAPELDLRAVVAVAPGGDLVAIAEWTYGPNGTPVAWLNALLAVSAWREVFGLSLDDVLTGEARELAVALQSTCPDYTRAPSEQPLTVDLPSIDRWRQLLEANTPGRSRAEAPILVMQGTDDEQVPLLTTLSAVERLRAVGADVELRILEGGGHEAGLFGSGSLVEIQAWIAHRMSGRRTSPNREPARAAERRRV